MKLGVMPLLQKRIQAPAVMVTNLTEREVTTVRLIIVKMGTALIVRDLIMKMGIARNVLIAATVLIARVLTRMERMATALSVLMATMPVAIVLIVPATTAKAATVPSALTATMPVATVLTVPVTTAKAATVPSALTATMPVATVLTVPVTTAKAAIVLSALTDLTAGVEFRIEISVACSGKRASGHHDVYENIPVVLAGVVRQERLPVARTGGKQQECETETEKSKDCGFHTCVFFYCRIASELLSSPGAQGVISLLSTTNSRFFTVTVTV